MKLTILLWRREGISIVRNTFQIILLTIVFLLGIYAVYYGHSKITEQRKIIENVKHIENSLV